MTMDRPPDPLQMPLEMADTAMVAKEMRQLLLDEMPLDCDISCTVLPNYNQVLGKTAQLPGLQNWHFAVLRHHRVCQWTVGGDRVRYDMLDESRREHVEEPVQLCGTQLISKDPDDRKTTAKSSTVRSSSPIRSQKIDLFHVTFKINAGASSIKKHLAKKPPANPPVVDTPPATQPGSVSLPGSSSSSPSSSTSSLDNKPQPSPWQRLVHPWPRNPVCTKRPSVVKTAPPCANTTASIARVHGSMDSLTDISSAAHNHFFPCKICTLLSGWKENPQSLTCGLFAGIKRNFSTSSTVSSQRELSMKSPVDSTVQYSMGLLSVGNLRYFTCRPNHGVLMALMEPSSWMRKLSFVYKKSMGVLRVSSPVPILLYTITSPDTVAIRAAQSSSMNQQLVTGAPKHLFAAVKPLGTL
ncbi:CLIP4 protein, partial [Polyodon spathula]|nr:CLIP4 protein [Polyodon spathula]